MDYLMNHISRNLKQIRRAKNMSLDEVAEQTGVSKSMLAQIERGEANPTIGILGKIASGLRIEFKHLIQVPKLANQMISIKDMVPTKEMPGQYKVYTCFPYEDNQLFEIYRIEIEPGQMYFSGSHGEYTKEYMVIVQGNVNVEIEGQEISISTEDIFKFLSDKPHIYKNHTEQRTIFYIFFVAD